MTIIDVLLGFIFMVSGGFVGIRRLAFVSVVFISGFLSFAAYRGYHHKISYAIASLGIEPSNSFFIGLFMVTLIPLFLGIYIGVKIIGVLGITEYGNGYGYDETSVVDRIFGSGFGLLIYLIIFSIFMR